MATRFEVLMEIHTMDGQAVSFKQDGQRFTDPTTVKMCVDEKYNLGLRFKPANKLLAWSMQDEDLSFKEEKQSITKKDKDMAAYSAVWTSHGFNKTRNGKRDSLRIRLELEDDHVLETTMQIKFYNSKDGTASKWGQPMHVLDLSCDAKPGDHFITVRRGSIL